MALQEELEKLRKFNSFYEKKGVGIISDEAYDAVKLAVCSKYKISEDEIDELITGCSNEPISPFKKMKKIYVNEDMYDHELELLRLPSSLNDYKVDGIPVTIVYQKGYGKYNFKGITKREKYCVNIDIIIENDLFIKEMINVIFSNPGTRNSCYLRGELIYKPSKEETMTYIKTNRQRVQSVLAIDQKSDVVSRIGVYVFDYKSYGDEKVIESLIKHNNDGWKRVIRNCIDKYCDGIIQKSDYNTQIAIKKKSCKFFTTVARNVVVKEKLFNEKRHSIKIIIDIDTVTLDGINYRKAMVSGNNDKKKEFIEHGLLPKEGDIISVTYNKGCTGLIYELK